MHSMLLHAYICKQVIMWNGFQSFPTLQYKPSMVLLSSNFQLSYLLQGCQFHAVTWSLLRGHRCGRRRRGHGGGRDGWRRAVLEVDAAPPAALDGLGGVDLDDLEAVLGPVNAVAARSDRRDVLEVLLLAQEEGGGGGVRWREE